MPMTEWGKRRPGDSVVVSVGCRCPPPWGGAARLISSEPFGTVLFGPLASPFPLPSLVGAGLGGGVEIKVDLFSQSAACAMGPYCCKSVSIFIIVSHSAGKCCHSFLVGVRFLVAVGLTCGL